MNEKKTGTTHSIYQPPPLEKIVCVSRMYAKKKHPHTHPHTHRQLRCAPRNCGANSIAHDHESQNQRNNIRPPAPAEQKKKVWHHVSYATRQPHTCITRYRTTACSEITVRTKKPLSAAVGLLKPRAVAPIVPDLDSRQHQHRT